MSIDAEVKLLALRRTKIVATLGPASNDAGTIARLIKAGVYVIRLNMSHGKYAGHRETFEAPCRMSPRGRQVRFQQDSQLRVDKRQIPAMSGHSANINEPPF